MKGWALVVVLPLLVAALPAQVPSARREQEALRAQRSLQQNRAEVDRLLDLRMRHDLGLPTDDSDRTFQHDTPVTATAMDEMRRQQREEEAATVSLRQRFDVLRRSVEQLRADAAARAMAEEQQQSFVSVPTTGSTIGGVQPVAPSPVMATIAPDTPAAAPGPEGQLRHEDEVDGASLQLDPPRAQIHGSNDHQRVAQALFKAGQALMDRADAARTQGRLDVAKDLDGRARERLLRAVDELAPLLEAEEPAFVALFYLGRCRELLFRYSERHDGLSLTASPRDYQRREQEVREPFLQISARDVTATGERGAVEVLGAWGQAAQTAMEHFRWMNQHSGYDARGAIEKLTWPGEGDR